MQSKITLTLCVALTLAAPAAWADWTEFIPRAIRNEAFVDTFGSYERDKNRGEGPNSARWDDTFFREKVTFYSIGYSYHPRFLQYQFSIGGALSQENYDSSETGSTGWGNDEGLEYDARIFLLPEHVYRLEAFARRFEPLFKEQSATHHNNVETSYGTAFRYRKKPYFLHVSYVDDSVDSGITSSDVSRFGLDGQYIKRFTDGDEVSCTGAFNPSWFSNSQGLDGHTYEYLLGNALHFPQLPVPFRSTRLPVEARLSSSLTKNTTWQDQQSQSFDYDQVVWYELLNLYWPLGFRTNLSYRQQDNTGTISSPTQAQQQNPSNKTKDLYMDVIHRLYESLDTTYSFRREWQDYSGGNATNTTHTVALNYAKLLPERSRLLVGGNFSRMETDNSGQATVLNQAFPGTAVPGTITLLQQSIDPTSIVVLLKSPLPPFELILLTEGVDYTVQTLTTSTEIAIFNLPSQFVVPGTYEFSVSYTLLSGQFDLRIDTLGSDVSVQMFDDLLTPYGSYVRVRSDVLSGTFPGIPVDSTTYTTGLLFHRDGLRLRGEYQELDWNISPYRLWTLEAQYVLQWNASTSAYSTATYTNKYYPHGASPFFPGQIATVSNTAYREEAESVAASIQKQLIPWNMWLSGGGSYSHLQGLVDSDSFSVNGVWTWRVGLVDLSVGATVYAADTSGTGTISTRRDHELVYMRLRRRLF